MFDTSNGTKIAESSTGAVSPMTWIDELTTSDPSGDLLRSLEGEMRVGKNLAMTNTIVGSTLR